MEMIFEQRQVMDPPGCKGRGQDLVGVQVNAQLCFNRVILFLTVP